MQSRTDIQGGGRKLSLTDIQGGGYSIRLLTRNIILVTSFVFFVVPIFVKLTDIQGG